MRRLVEGVRRLTREWQDKEATDSAASASKDLDQGDTIAVPTDQIQKVDRRIMQVFCQFEGCKRGWYIR